MGTNGEARLQQLSVNLCQFMASIERNEGTIADFLHKSRLAKCFLFLAKTLGLTKVEYLGPLTQWKRDIRGYYELTLDYFDHARPSIITADGHSLTPEFASTVLMDSGDDYLRIS